MGGSICVAVREADGTEHVGGYWTNYMPIVLSNPKFYEDSETLKKFIERGKKCENINRSEYGIILVDFLQKKIVSANGYSSPGSLLFVVGEGAYSDGDYASLIMDMKDKGWIKSFSKEWGDTPLLPHEEQKLLELCAARAPLERKEPGVQRSFGERMGVVYVNYCPPGWTIENFHDDQPGFRKVRARMKSGKWKTPWGRERISIYGD